jgi:DoxX-like family
MNTAYLTVAGLTILANLGAAASDFAKADFVVKTADEVRVPRSWIPVLGALKAVGAVAVGLGILGVPYMGTAGAAGLVAFFVGAIVFHVRAHVLYNVAFPALFLALAATSLALARN